MKEEIKNQLEKALEALERVKKGHLPTPEGKELIGKINELKTFANERE